MRGGAYSFQDLLRGGGGLFISGPFDCFEGGAYSFQDLLRGGCLFISGPFEGGGLFISGPFEGGVLIHFRTF